MIQKMLYYYLIMRISALFITKVPPGEKISMTQKRKSTKNKLFSFSSREFFIACLIYAVSLAMSLFIQSIEQSDTYVSMLFILSVFLISRFTTGYLYGIIFSLLTVLTVNFAFTYPYFKFNFTVTGYPVTMLCMLAVAITTSTLSSTIKRQTDLQIEAEREKTRANLLRAISHDLRTPITSIIGASSTILENDDLITPEDRIKLIHDINEDSRWLIRMVENLLSITRIDEGREARIVKIPEAAEEVVAEAVRKFKKQFPGRSVTVSVPDEFLMVPMDSTLIFQVLTNLLENAVYHAGPDASISVSLYRINNMACFEVSDDGCGIDEKKLPNILEGYYTSDYENTSDGKKNMGIGLSVCNTIVKAHLGLMTAENKPDGGAKFTFMLPIGSKEENK